MISEEDDSLLKGFEVGETDSTAELSLLRIQLFYGKFNFLVISGNSNLIVLKFKNNLGFESFLFYN